MPRLPSRNPHAGALAQPQHRQQIVQDKRKRKAKHKALDCHTDQDYPATKD
jgi:hypothetical protein